MSIMQVLSFYWTITNLHPGCKDTMNSFVYKLPAFAEKQQFTHPRHNLYTVVTCLKDKIGPQFIGITKTI